MPDEGDDFASHGESASASEESGPPAVPSEEAVRVAAFEAFYRSHMPRLVGLLIWQGAGVHIAADLAHDAMREAWRQWAVIRHPWAWVRRTAGRLLIRWLIEDRETPVDQAVSPLLPGPDAMAELETRYTALRLLGHLPFRQRQVLALTLDGLTPTEIADELEVTSAAVRASLMKARQHVVELLAKEEQDRG